MVKTIGPAVGSKGQVAFKEESKWGFPCSPPDKFVEFTSEGVASEFTNLVSASLRSDRAVHKQRTGTETAGGDVNMEFGPEGIETWLKHALGKKRTKRKDVAMVLVFTGAGANVYVDVSATKITSVGVTGGGNLDVNITNGQTMTNLIALVDGSSKWNAYAPWGTGANGYFGLPAATAKTSAVKLYGTADFDGTGTVCKTSGGVLNLETFSHVPIKPSTNADRAFLPIFFKYGIYEHTLDAAPTLPEGMSLEIGRDVAAFNYYGCKVNSVALTLNPSEIATATFNVMSKGASTCGDPIPFGSCTGWANPFLSLRYAGSAANAYTEINIDGSRDMFHFEMGAAGTELEYSFPLTRGTCTHDGFYYDVTTLKGFVEFLDHDGYFSMTRKAGYDPSFLCRTTIGGLADFARTQLLATADQNWNLTANPAITPLVRGNYIGTDVGESVSIYVDITTAGATNGTAGFKGSNNNSTWSLEQKITSGIWYSVKFNGEVDSGFQVMWPESSTQTLGDTWVFTSFKDEKAGATFPVSEPFTGFQGAVTIDGVAQGIMSLNFTLTNNLFGDKFELGDRQRAALIEQRRTTEGTINTEFDNLDLYRKFVNGTSGNLVVTLTSDQYVNAAHGTKYSFVVRLPNIKFYGATPVIGGADIITTDFPFNALYDDVTPCPDLRITITNGQAYV